MQLAMLQQPRPDLLLPWERLSRADPLPMLPVRFGVGDIWLGKFLVGVPGLGI